MIFFSVARESDVLVENPIYSCQYNFEKADWKNLIKDISAEQNNEKLSWSLKELSAESLEFEAEKLQKLVINLMEKHILRKKLSEKSKSWWSDELRLAVEPGWELPSHQGLVPSRSQSWLGVGS